MNLVSDLVIKKLFQEDGKHGWHTCTDKQENMHSGSQFHSLFCFNYFELRNEEKGGWTPMSYVLTNNITTPPNSGQPYKKFWKKKKHRHRKNKKKTWSKAARFKTRKSFLFGKKDSEVHRKCICHQFSPPPPAEAAASGCCNRCHLQEGSWKYNYDANTYKKN